MSLCLVRRMILRAYLLAIALLCVSKIGAAEPPSQLRSPNGEYTIRILDQKLPGADPDFSVSIAVYHGGKLLSQFPTIGFLTAAHWSPDGRFVAVNNRRGTYGDYFWVFHLRDGRALKQPSDASPLPGQPMYSSEALLTRVRAKFPEYGQAGYYKFGAHAERWTDANELESAAVVTFTHIDNDLVRIFDTYAISEDGLRLIRTHMTKERQGA